MNSFKSAFLLIIFWMFLFWNFSFAGNPFVRNLLWTQLEIGLNQRSSVWEFRDWRAGNSLLLQTE